VRKAAVCASTSAAVIAGVDPDHSHQGIARAFSVFAINYLVAKGLTHSMLYVDADNEKGLALYTSLGFN
jgi:ribosomal protein S18 acetylase RimI-like enzyme